MWRGAVALERNCGLGRIAHPVPPDGRKILVRSVNENANTYPKPHASNLNAPEISANSDRFVVADIDTRSSSGIGSILSRTHLESQGPTEGEKVRTAKECMLRSSVGRARRAAGASHRTAVATPAIALPCYGLLAAEARALSLARAARGRLRRRARGRPPVPPPNMHCGRRSPPRSVA